MPRVQRRWDVIEIHAERGFSYALVSLAFLGIAWLLWAFRGGGMFVPLSIILGIIGLSFFGWAISKAVDIKKVSSFMVLCPICDFDNELTAQPTQDFICSNCQRIVPIQDGKPLEVKQVKCAYCAELNYYSDKTEYLICETCNHEIPISTTASQKASPNIVAKAFAVTQDEKLYEFVLVAHGQKTEELITTLQHMLALNRNQVKQMLSELPVTILTGITRRKAEILQAQLALHEAATEFRPIVAARS